MKAEVEFRNGAKLSIHKCCWHALSGPIMMVIPDGHVVQKCCECPESRVVHRDHATSGHAGLLRAES